MKLRIERSIGEAFMCYDIEGDVSDVLQVAEYVIAIDSESNVTINSSSDITAEQLAFFMDDLAQAKRSSEQLP